MKLLTLIFVMLGSLLLVVLPQKLWPHKLAVLCIKLTMQPKLLELHRVGMTEK